MNLTPNFDDALIEDRSATGAVYRLPVRAISRGLLALAVFSSAFVIKEPAPYELIMLALISLFALFGMRFGKHAILLTTLMGLFVFGGLLSMFTMANLEGIPLYLAVTLFLGLTSVFWCAAIAGDASRLQIIFRAYVAGAVITACAGIVGYLQLVPGAELFTRYDRAMGVFQDPNVFGPFLILPALYLIYGILYRSPVVSIFRAALLLVLLLGLFLSFSRGAWGTFSLSAFLTYMLLVATERSAGVRARLILLGILGAGALVMLLIVALQFDVVSDMFEIRAKAVQDYDGERVGRFARHLIGFQWALENPLGIGPLHFGILLGEDTHNIWVKALMAYGWVGFIAWFTLTIITLIGGARLLGKKRPWQPYLICTWSTFVAHNLLGWVIDLDHWRHFFLLIGIIWGCMALEARYQRDKHLKVQISG